MGKRASEEESPELALLGLKRRRKYSEQSSDIEETHSDSPSTEDESEGDDLQQEAKLEAQWNDRFERLKEFQKQHGHLFVPRKTEKQLNRWCITQRAYRRENKLSQERIDKLNTLNFEWGRSDSRQTEWEKQFEKMKAFIAKNGHSSVSVNKDKKLNKWVEKQRASRKNGTMNEERVKRLDAIGFQWKGRDYNKEWTQNFELMQQFKASNGHIDVTSAPLLNKWLKYQITLKKKGLLSPSKVEKLEGLGVQWPIDEWMLKLEKVREFVAARGHCRIPEEEDLGKWLKAQKKARRAKCLTQKKMRLLEELGIDWNWESKWQRAFEKLKQHRERHGTLDVPELLPWIYKQRDLRNRGALTPERALMLESLGLSWRQEVEIDAEWEAQFARLERSVNSQVNVVFPMIEKDLYFWMRKQMAEKQRGLLSNHKLFKLGRLSVWNSLVSQESAQEPQASAMPW